MTSSFEANFYICFAHKCSSLQWKLSPPRSLTPFCKGSQGQLLRVFVAQVAVPTHQLQASVRSPSTVVTQQRDVDMQNAETFTAAVLLPLLVLLVLVLVPVLVCR